MKISKNDVRLLGTSSVSEIVMDFIIPTAGLMIGGLTLGVFGSSIWGLIGGVAVLGLSVFGVVSLTRKVNRRSKLSKAIDNYFVETYSLHGVAYQLSFAGYFGNTIADKDEILVDGYKLVYDEATEEFEVFEDLNQKVQKAVEAPVYVKVESLYASQDETSSNEDVVSEVAEVAPLVDDSRKPMTSN